MKYEYMIVELKGGARDDMAVLNTYGHVLEVIGRKDLIGDPRFDTAAERKGEAHAAGLQDHAVSPADRAVVPRHVPADGAGASRMQSMSVRAIRTVPPSFASLS
jgi:hypothetical protein